MDFLEDKYAIKVQTDVLNCNAVGHLKITNKTKLLWLTYSKSYGLSQKEVTKIQKL